MQSRAGELEAGTPGAAPAGFDMAMAFCRLASDQARCDPSSKPSKECRCLFQVLDAALESLQAGRSVNLIDLGAGNGEKGLQTISALNGAGHRPVLYYPIDLSPYCGLYAVLTVLVGTGGVGPDEARALLGAPPGEDLLQALSQRPLPYETVIREICQGRPSADAIRRPDVVVPTRGIALDFVAGSAGLTDRLRRLAMFRPGASLFCVLGQTLGNYGAATRGALLRDLRRQMTPGDLLLVDGGLRPEEGVCRWDDLNSRIANLVAFYGLGEYFMRHEADCPGSIYRVAYNTGVHRVEYWFERSDGSRQDLGFSHMWTAESFRDELRSAGLDVLGCASSLDVPDLRSGPESIAALARTEKAA